MVKGNNKESHFGKRSYEVCRYAMNTSRSANIDNMSQCKIKAFGSQENLIEKIVTCVPLYRII